MGRLQVSEESSSRPPLRIVFLNVVAVALFAGGCHRTYQVQGSVNVVPSVARRASFPAVVCTAFGDPSGQSVVHGHTAAATILCAPPRAPETFPLREDFYYGSMPTRAHVYAWLEPLPVAEKLCAESGKPTVLADLYALKLQVQNSTHRADPSWPCGDDPRHEAPMTYAVTFDPDHKTWDEGDGAMWVERRTLTIE
jgi:hypothetical protein